MFFNFKKKNWHSETFFFCSTTTIPLRELNYKETNIDSQYEFSDSNTDTVATANHSECIDKNEGNNCIKKTTTEFFIGNIQSCQINDNNKSLLKTCAQIPQLNLQDNKSDTINSIPLSELSHRDSGFLDRESACSTSTMASLQQTNSNILKLYDRDMIKVTSSKNETRQVKAILKKSPSRHKKKEDECVDEKEKESSSSDIDEIARINQMELRRQVVKTRKKSLKDSTMNTIPKPKPRSNINIKNVDAKNLDVKREGSLLNKSFDCHLPQVESTTPQHDLYQVSSPMLNSCGLIMCPTALPTQMFHSFIPASLIPISFPNANPAHPNAQLFIQPVAHALTQANLNTTTLVQNETTAVLTEQEKVVPNTKKTHKTTKSVSFAKLPDSPDKAYERKFKALKKTSHLKEKTIELDAQSSAWMKRQAIKTECNRDSTTLPNEFVVTQTQEILFMKHNNEDNSNNNDNSDLNETNSDEFQFFVNAIEKLKAANLFHEDDLKKMTDEQIYEALIEHARLQKKGINPVVSGSLCQSIDRDDEDLPIIMRNLHSVKSLKHYFEIKAKSVGENPSVGSPKHTAQKQNEKSNELTDNSKIQVSAKLNQQNSPVKTILNENESKENEKNEIKIENLSDSECKEEQSIVQSEATSKNQSVTPPKAPPLPEFLFKTLNTSESLKELIARNSLLKHSESFRKRRSAIEIQTGCCSPTPFNEHKDLHEKLIKEIHHKSMERSKKETNICLDEQGNLIHKPVGRVYTSVKNHKVYRIKDNSAISSVEIKDIKSQILSSLNQTSAVTALTGTDSNSANSEYNSRINDQNDNSISISEVISDKNAVSNKENVARKLNKFNLNRKESFMSSSHSTTTIDDNEPSKNSKDNNELVDSVVMSASENSDETMEPIEITQSFITHASNNSVATSLLPKINNNSVGVPVLMREFSIPDSVIVNKKNLKNELQHTTIDSTELTSNRLEDYDQISELVSISQVPSVFPSLDRRDAIYKSNSFRMNSTFDSNFLEAVQEIHRTTSFRSDISAGETSSIKSTRSMLSEAKAKLEILSAKFTKSNSNTVQSKFQINNKIEEKQNIDEINDENSKINDKNKSDEEEQVTQF